MVKVGRKPELGEIFDRDTGKLVGWRVLHGHGFVSHRMWENLLLYQNTAMTEGDILRIAHRRKTNPLLWEFKAWSDTDFTKTVRLVAFMDCPKGQQIVRWTALMQARFLFLKLVARVLNFGLYLKSRRWNNGFY